MIPRLKPRPWWLFWLGRDRWLTVAPTIYHPRSVNPELFPALIAHEQTQLSQQTGHEIIWLIRYLLQPSFRLSQEVEAIAVEVSFYTPTQRAAIVNWYATALSSAAYLWAAFSRSTALNAITTAVIAKETARDQA